MKRFLFKCLTFFLIVIGIISLILIKYGGYVDYFYEKFTTPKASSFILGDSRSMQGIQPKVFNDYFNSSDYELPMTNYSFTISQIAYGPLYTESIQRKFNHNTNNGLFIITVNPWILSSREGYIEENGEFFETNMPPHNMKFTTLNPNFEYLIKNFNYFHFKSIIRKSSKMHKDGWLEESNLPKDSLMLNSWKKNQIKLYSDFALKWKKSNFRLKGLEELIEYLDDFGDVVLLRMPIDEKLISIENEFWVNFDMNIQSIASKMNVEYLNFVKNNKYKTYDGNHLDKFGGIDFTRDLCDSISSRLIK